MKKKLSFLFSYKNLLIGLSAFCLVLIGVSLFTDRLVTPMRSVVSSVVVPFQKGLNNIGLWTSDKAAAFQEINNLIYENESLKKQADSLVEENNQLKQETYELDRLRELYELDKKYPGYTKVGARVIAKGTSNWFNTFTIDKGTADGIEMDMNVIADGGLVGIISEVGEHYSIVMSIIDDNSNVSGMQIGTGANCIVKGNLHLMDSGLIEVKYFDKKDTLKDGDKIVTSNISQNYLEGILIGYLKDVKLDSNNLSQSGYLVPIVDFENLQEVLVILEKKQTYEEKNN